LHDQLKKVQEELQEAGVSHEGMSAEEAYAERLAQINSEAGVVQEGTKMVSSLLGRCLIWVEIIVQK